METFVVNLDSEPGRWRETRRECLRVGLNPVRFSATPDSGHPTSWVGRPLEDVSRRQAIVATYQRLLDVLEMSDADEWLVMQDDVTIRTPPDPPESSLIHCFGGWRIRYLTRRSDGMWRPIEDSWHLASLDFPAHVCPQAFYLHRDLLDGLRECWSDTTRQVCETWTPLLADHATYEPEPTIEPT